MYLATRNSLSVSGQSKSRGVVCMLVVLVSIVFNGCGATKQPRGPLASEVQNSGFLGDLYPKMVDGESGQVLRLYKNQDLKTFAAKKYNSVIIDSVTIYAGKNSQMKDASKEELQDLANVFARELAAHLKPDFKLVNSPGPRTLRIETALTDAEPTETVLKALSFVPWGIPGLKFGVLKSKELATGKPVFVGEVTAEMKLTDSQSGEVLLAAVDRRVGGRLGGGWSSWTDAKEAFRYWSEKVRYALCKQIRLQTNCVEPKE